MGAACDENQPCKPDLQCHRRRCEKPLAAGASCVPTDRDLGALLCDATQLLGCAVADAPVCAPIRYAQVGAACGLRDGELFSCSAASCTAGKCVADLKEGESCNATDAPCEVPLGCVAGKCARASIASCK
jgi:hypothetical protein